MIHKVCPAQIQISTHGGACVEQASSIIICAPSMQSIQMHTWLVMGQACSERLELPGCSSKMSLQGLLMTEIDRHMP